VSVDVAHDTLPATIEDLRARLAEAEETLRAIRSGEVDALVIDGEQGVQVYTLKGAEEPYRILVERMRDGALTLTSDGVVVYANRHVAELLALPLERITGQLFRSFVVETQHAALEISLRAAREGWRGEFALVRGDGASVPALLSFSELPVQGVSAVAVIVTDLAEQKRRDELAAAARFAKAVLEQATEAMVVCDARGRITYASRAAVVLAGRDPAGLTLAEALPALGTVTAGTAVEEQSRAALAGSVVHGVEVEVGAPEGRRFCLLSAGPLRDGTGTIRGSVVTLIDITRRKQAEQHQQLLLRELSHRVKNMLALILSVARQTGARITAVDDFLDAFEGRLHALAAAHELLTESGWRNTSLAELARAALAAHDQPGSERIGIGIEDLPLTPAAAQDLVLVLHELATNAAKHGALSVPGGAVTLAGRIAGGELVLAWSEAGGPPVAPPSEVGFGTMLLEQIVEHRYEGRVELDWRSEGLVCTLRIPTAEFAGRAEWP
jgi:PAS domain S-box-containing protein